MTENEEEQEKKRLKNVRSGHMSYLTKIYRDIEGMMKSYNNVELVREKEGEMEAAYGRFVQSHKMYFMCLKDSGEKRVANDSYESQCEGKIEFDSHIKQWFDAALNYEKTQIRSDMSDNCSHVSRVSRASSNSNCSQNKFKDSKVKHELAKLEMEQLEEQIRIDRELANIEMQKKRMHANNKIDRANLETQFWNEEVEREYSSKWETRPGPILSPTAQPCPKAEISNLNPAAAGWKHEDVPNYRDHVLEQNMVQILKTQQNTFQTMAQAVREGFDLPKPELLKFDGSPIEYWKFMQNFEVNIASRVNSDKSKLSYLIQLCTGEPRESIEDCVLLDSKRGYEEAKDILLKQYGQPHIIAHAYVNQLITGPLMRGSCGAGLSKLAREMRKCNITLTQMGYIADMNNSENLLKIVGRLPFHIQGKWAETADHIIQTGTEPNFSHLAKFVEERSRVANSMYGQHVGKTMEKFVTRSKANERISPKHSTFASESEIDSLKAHDGVSDSDGNVDECTCNKCPLCYERHKLDNCKKFRMLDIGERIKFMRNQRSCDNCLLKGHIAIGCLERRMCEIENCKRKHHTLLHSTFPRNYYFRNQGENHSPENSGRERNCNSTGTGSRICLRIIPVRVRGNGREIDTYAMLDNGSDTSLCENKLLDELGVTGIDRQFSLTTVNNENTRRTGKEVILKVSGVEEDEVVELPSVLSVDRLPISEESIPNDEDFHKWAHLKGLEFPKIRKREVMLLIGSDVPEVFWTLEERRGKRKEPYAIRSLLGWSLIGPTNSSSNDLHVHFVQRREMLLQRQIDCLWNTDFQDSIAGPEVAMSKEDCTALEIMKRTLTKVDGHFQVGLPWRRKHPELPNNRILAEGRLRYLKRRFTKDERLFEKYKNTISTYITHGYARIAPLKTESSGMVWYLPHHPVINPQKPHKLRVVFDCAAQYKQISLNNELLQGPDLCNSLIGVILRFRKESIAMVADIEAMFHQIRVLPKDCEVLRFLWWPGNDMNKPPVDYQMRVHIFGATSSPSVSSYCLRKTAEDNDAEFENEVVETVTRNFYVDDCLKSVETVAKAKKLIPRLCQLLQRGGFRLNKWICNNREVLSGIPESERSTSVLNLDLEKLPIERTLGIQWDTEADQFGIQIAEKDKPHTRRGILSVISSLYDPLGFVAPFVLPAKVLLQDLCRRKLGWDEEIEVKDVVCWKNWLNDLSKLSNIKIDRCIKPSAFYNVVSFHLHHFADASQQAYGAVSYVRLVNESNDIHCAFLLGKSRLAPLKTITIPRLELTAAVLAVKLDRIIKRELDLPEHETFFWTDSTSVLQFIRNKNKRFPTFISNRLTKIEDGSDESQWKYVNTNLNPADEASRGNKATKMVKGHWLNGPEFLWSAMENWPDQPLIANIPDMDSEIKLQKQVHNILKPSSLDNLIDTTYSSWYRLKKGVSWLLRVKRYLLYLVRGLKRVDICLFPLKGSLNVRELQEAEKAIIAHVQRREFPQELAVLRNVPIDKGGGKKAIKAVKFVKSLHKLNPIIMDGLLRVGGRLENAPIDYEAKHPPILPNNHPVTNLIISEHHLEVGHSGVGMTWSSLRPKYWIVRGGVAVRRVVGNCLDCKKRNSPYGKQLMANLPVERITPNKPPFSYVGVDYFGPLYVKQARSQVKRYGCLFTCLNIRAVHIEIAHSLTTDAFINALRRFISRRGKPEIIYSDNGTNFVGAERELRESIKEWNQNKIDSFLIQKNIDWKFNPPGASHMGGAWERMIRSVRKIMKSLLKEQLVNDETLLTFIAEVESILNSRPLTPISVDPRDGNPLTPNHLLLLRQQSNIPPGIFSKADSFTKRRWRQVQFLADEFWKRWSREYLPLLQIRQKWTKSLPDFAVGDLVLVADSNKPRGQWPMGKISEVFPDKNGKVRFVEVKTAESCLRRPVVKLCHLGKTDEK